MEKLTTGHVGGDTRTVRQTTGLQSAADGAVAEIEAALLCTIRRRCHETVRIGRHATGAQQIDGFTITANVDQITVLHDGLHTTEPWRTGVYTRGNDARCRRRIHLTVIRPTAFAVQNDRRPRSRIDLHTPRHALLPHRGTLHRIARQTVGLRPTDRIATLPVHGRDQRGDIQPRHHAELVLHDYFQTVIARLEQQRIVHHDVRRQRRVERRVGRRSNQVAVQPDRRIVIRPQVQNHQRILESRIETERVLIGVKPVRARRRGAHPLRPRNRQPRRIRIDDRCRSRNNAPARIDRHLPIVVVNAHGNKVPRVVDARIRRVEQITRRAATLARRRRDAAVQVETRDHAKLISHDDFNTVLSREEERLIGHVDMRRQSRVE